MRKSVACFILVLALIFVLVLVSACGRGQNAEHEPTSDVPDDVLYEEAVDFYEPEPAPPVPLSRPTNHIKTILAHDEHTISGRLVMPAGDEPVEKLVIYVPGSGINTMLNRHYLPDIGHVNYIDFWVDNLVAEGVAFFSYNQRGVGLSGMSPYYTLNHWYWTYLPHNSVLDVYHIINALVEHERLADAAVLLLGMSEGTVISPLVAEEFPHLVDGLFLMGTPISGMYDILRWQNAGYGSMVWFHYHFDADDYGRISQEAFNADPHGVVDTVLMGSDFHELDTNGDGYIDILDIQMQLDEIDRGPEYTQELLFRIEIDDRDWVWANYPVRLSPGWFRYHFALRPNYQVLPELNLPIYIFHGRLDQNAYVGRVYDMYDRFAELGRTNLTVQTFAAHDHGLNGWDWFLEGQMSEGRQAVLDAIIEFTVVPWTYFE